MFKTILTNKDLSQQLHKSGVSDLMIKEGIEPMAWWVKWFDDYILYLKRLGVYISVYEDLEYAEKEFEELSNSEYLKPIPAWCAEQLWDYLITLFPITYKNKYLHLDIENQKKSSLNSICFFPTVIDEDDREMFSYGGKLTDPSVPANMLLKLQEMGLLK